MIHRIGFSIVGVIAAMAPLPVSACDEADRASATTCGARMSATLPVGHPSILLVDGAAPPSGKSGPSANDVAAHRAANANASPVLLAEDTALALTGLTMTAPAGWLIDPITPGPHAAKAAYRLPSAGGDSADATIRITHYPRMKGKDDANINRWIGQVHRSDGAPSTRDDAKINVSEAKGIKRTIVELSGSVRATMRSTPTSNGRMIAVILDHAKGPHFIVVAGGAKTIDKWDAAIRAFLDSAKVK